MLLHRAILLWILTAALIFHAMLPVGTVACACTRNQSHKHSKPCCCCSSPTVKEQAVCSCCKQANSSSEFGFISVRLCRCCDQKATPSATPPAEQLRVQDDVWAQLMGDTHRPKFFREGASPRPAFVLKRATKPPHFVQIVYGVWRT